MTKVSVLVVAHNEGKNIAQCLDSHLKQFYGLTWADDLYLSLSLSKIGKVVFVPTAKIITQVKDNTFMGWLRRGKHQREDKVKLFDYFQ